jgi:hypothetical protein
MGHLDKERVSAPTTSSEMGATTRNFRAVIPGRRPAFSGLSIGMNDFKTRHPACPGMPWEGSPQSGEPEGACVCSLQILFIRIGSNHPIGFSSRFQFPSCPPLLLRDLCGEFLKLVLLFSVSPCLRGAVLVLIVAPLRRVPVSPWCCFAFAFQPVPARRGLPNYQLTQLPNSPEAV